MEIKLTIKGVFENDIHEHIYSAENIDEAIMKMNIVLGTTDNLDTIKEFKWERIK